MKNATTSRGWLTLGLGMLGLALTWWLDRYMMFSWIMAICSINICWLALTRLKLGLTQFLLVGASLMNAAAGTANGLVMAANGGRMPVESVLYWGNSPSFLDDESDQTRLVCKLLAKADDGITPRDDSAVHYSLPLPRILHGQPQPTGETPNLAFLDDRHTVSVCGLGIVYSKGDMMGFIGTVMLGIPGIAMLILGILWRKIRRKRDAPT